MEENLFSNKRLIKVFFTILVCLTFLGFFAAGIRQPLVKFLNSHENTQERGIVTAVFDGDTIKVKFRSGLEKRVRLIGIESPEMDDEREEVGFWAFMAKRFAFYFLYKKEVRLSYDWQKEDDYGRILAYVWKDKMFFNDFIVREGFAYAFLKFPFRKDYQNMFKESEELARKEGRGLWFKGQYPLIGVSDIKRHIGELISIKFVCKSIETKRGFVFLNASKRSFAALIPTSYLAKFPSYKSFKNRNLMVTGFLEEFQGQPQIVISFPRQIN